MIKLTENSGVKNIKDIHKEIKNELKKNEEVIIDFSSVDRIDLSIVQLVISTGRESKNSGKTLRLKAVSEKVKYLMQLCGLKA